MRGTKDSIRGLKQVMRTEQIKGEPFPPIIICESDRGKVRTPHDDPMVVELKVANMKVRRILIDTGSSSDIISLSCLKNLKCDEKSVEPVSHPLVGFGGGIIYPVGRVDLAIRLWEKGKSRSLFVRFLMVDDLTA